MLVLNSNILDVVDLTPFKNQIEYKYVADEIENKVLYQARLVTAIHREWRSAAEDNEEARQVFEKDGVNLLQNSIRNHLNSIRRFIDVKLLFEEVEPTDE